MEELSSILEDFEKKREAIRAMADSAPAAKKPDLLAASRMLERAIFHVDRAKRRTQVEKTVQADVGEMLDIEIEQDLLEANKRMAEENRELFRRYGVLAIDVMGAIGSGKTSLIAAMVNRLKGKKRCGMIGGDVATSIDSELVKESGAQSLQVNTGKECHLDANLIRRALESMNLDSVDVLFIENVGNLICPAEFDLGCSKNLVVVSVTEGEYMVVKHPMMFMEADVVAINKIDMAEAFGTDVDRLEEDLRSINPDAKAVRTSVRTGEGLDDLVSLLFPSLD